MTALLCQPPRQQHGSNGNAAAARPELDTFEYVKIRAHLYTIACSPAWVETILDVIRESQQDRDKRRRNQRHPRVRVAVDQRGRLKTKIPDLLIALEEAGIYPPVADDRPSN